MSEQYTAIELAFYPEYLNYWLRFGVPDQRVILDKRRSLALFKPGKLFGYVRWIANEYGTQDWRFVVSKVDFESQNLNSVEGVRPGCNVLLFTVGIIKVKRVLAQIDLLEKTGFDPCEVSGSYYRHLHNRLFVGLSVRPYSVDQHQAYLATQRMAI
jgi:hypothetical protein